MKEYYTEWLVLDAYECLPNEMKKDGFDFISKESWFGPYLTKKIAIHAAMGTATQVRSQDSADDFDRMQQTRNHTISVICRETTNTVHKTIVPETIPTTGDDNEVQNL